MNTKSATTAGLLGIFLGSVGAHSWYLGDKKKGIIHVCLFGSGLIVSLLATVILPMALSFSALLKMGALFTILGGIASAAMAGNGIWGLVEGIIILSQGDEGLARKGYAVAQPVMQQPVYGQPMAQPYTQPMQPGYAQPIPQPQPMQPTQPIQPAQPMQPVAPAEPVATPAEPAPAPEVPAEPVAQPVDQPTDAGQNE